MHDIITIEVTTKVEVNIDAYAAEYGLSPEEVGPDACYLLTYIAENEEWFKRVGVAKVRSVSAEEL